MTGPTGMDGVRGLHVRHVVQTRCPASFADVVVDVEPAGRFAVEVAPSVDTPGEYVEAFARGLRSGLPPGRAARVVVRRLLVHPVDSHAADFEHAGRLAARRLLDGG